MQEVLELHQHRAVALRDLVEGVLRCSAITRNGSLHDMVDQARSELCRITLLDDEMVDILIRHGFRSAQELFDAEAYEVASILSLEESDAEEIIAEAERVLDAIIMEESNRRKNRQSTPSDDDLPAEA